MSACLQHRNEAATAVQCHQIVATTHMRVTNEDLRDSSPTRQGHHPISLFGQEVDSHLLNVLDATSFEDLFGPVAIGANGGGVHLDGWHGVAGS